MTFKNALKLSFLNLDKVWKYILYRAIVWAVIIGLMSPCFFMLKQVAVDCFSGSALSNFVSTGAFYSGSITDSAYGLLMEVVNFVVSVAQMYPLVFAYYCFLIGILLPTLMNMGKYTIDAMIYGYMSSHAKNSFSNTYISGVGKAFVCGFFRSLFSLVFNLSIVGIFIGIMNIPGDTFKYFAPYILILCTALILTIKQMLVMGWGPAMIVCDISSTRGFGFGIKTTFRRFWVSFATCFLVYLVAVFLVIGLGVCSLLVVLPVFSTVMTMAEMILFFGNHGMKYYIDGETIISPKKHEELDKINQIKFLL